MSIKETTPGCPPGQGVTKMKNGKPTMASSIPPQMLWNGIPTTSFIQTLPACICDLCVSPVNNSLQSNKKKDWVKWNPFVTSRGMFSRFPHSDTYCQNPSKYLSSTRVVHLISMTKITTILKSRWHWILVNDKNVWSTPKYVRGLLKTLFVLFWCFSSTGMCRKLYVTVKTYFCVAKPTEKN